MEFKEKPASSVKPIEEPSTISFNQLNKYIFQYFRESDYEGFEQFKAGYSKVISEDYTNIDLLCNLNDLIYNYNTNHLTTEQKQHYKNLCTGIQMLNKTLKQYDKNNTDKVFVALLSGYLLKLIKMFYHD